MTNVIPLKPRKPPKALAKGLCQHGFHKWVIWQDKQFDSRQGKLVTVFRCERCGEQRVKAV
jgi:hypothetical protein